MSIRQANDWVTCWICGVGSMQVSTDHKYESAQGYCANCKYSWSIAGTEFTSGWQEYTFLYRNEFIITVRALNEEDAYKKALAGQWLAVSLYSPHLHGDLLALVDENLEEIE